MKTLLLAFLALAIVCLVPGCKSVPTVKGGKSNVELPDGTVVGSVQGDNAETPTTQTIERKSTRTLAAAPGLPTPPTPFGPEAHAPGGTRATQQPAPFAPVVIEENSERIETTVGSTQDVAAIAKIVTSHKNAIFSVLLAIALIVLARYQWQRQWWLGCFASVFGAYMALYTQNPWWGGAAFGVSCLLFAAYKFALNSNPVVAQAGAALGSVLRPPVQPASDLRQTP